MNIDQLLFFRDELEKRAFGIPLVRTQDLTPTALAGLKRAGVKNPDGLDVSELAAQMNVDESALFRGGMPSYTSSKKTAGGAQRSIRPTRHVQRSSSRAV